LLMLLLLLLMMTVAKPLTVAYYVCAYPTKTFKNNRFALTRENINSRAEGPGMLIADATQFEFAYYVCEC
jgi:hypothetical protein